MPRRFPRAFVALVVAAALAAPACSRKGDGGGDRQSAGKATTTTAAAPPVLTWTVEGLDPNGTKAPGDDVVAAVTATLNSYLATAVVAPLHTGTPAGDLTPLLSASALERVQTDPAARAAFVDEGLPKATKITAETVKATLSSVAGPDEVTALVAARLNLALHVVGPQIDVDIVRTGEVTLSPEADGWRIDSFLLHVERNSRDEAASS
ncbi:MAG TPA: hypothetical protein VF230_07145 [Acidimicrobiales bacterium]